jgi:hypothetical protein
MINLENQSFELPCPVCGFYNPATMKQIRLRDAIICRGCKRVIILDDYMNETRKAVRLINRALRELHDQLNKSKILNIRL